MDRRVQWWLRKCIGGAGEQASPSEWGVRNNIINKFNFSQKIEVFPKKGWMGLGIQGFERKKIEFRDSGKRGSGTCLF